MKKMIQIRNVPEPLHRQLKLRAAQAGMSLSDYLLAEVRRMLDRPTPDELRTRMSTRTPVIPRIPPAAAVRKERESR